MRVQGIEPDLLNGTDLAVLILQFAAALSSAHANPVGRLVGSAFKARDFYEGFQQDRWHNKQLRDSRNEPILSRPDGVKLNYAVGL